MAELLSLNYNSTMVYEDLFILLIDSGAGFARDGHLFSDGISLTIEKADDRDSAMKIISNSKILTTVLFRVNKTNLTRSSELAEHLNDSGLTSIIFLVDEEMPLPSLGDPLFTKPIIWLPQNCPDNLLLGNIKSRITEMGNVDDELKELKMDRELFELFLEFNPSYVFFKDVEVRTLKLSKNYEEMLGRPLKDLIGKNMFELFPSDLAKSMDADDRRILEKGEPFEVEEEMSGRHYTTSKFPIYRDNAPPLLAGFTMDITRRVQAEQELKKMATEDPLTGISNRRQLYISGQILLDNALRAKVPISVMMIDIDDFKLYNDTFGHQEGDKCLVKVADLIKEMFQRSNDITARFGGEEFTAVLFNMNSTQAREAGNKLCSSMEKMSIPHEASPTGKVVTFSIGVTSKLPEESDTLNDLIFLADKALYRAKESGKNRSEFLE